MKACVFFLFTLTVNVNSSDKAQHFHFLLKSRYYGVYLHRKVLFEVVLSNVSDV